MSLKSLINVCIFRAYTIVLVRVSLSHVTVFLSGGKYKQEASLKKLIVEGYRAVGSLNGSFQSSNFLLLLLLFLIDFGQW